MANLILASKREVKSGAMMWHVYRSEDSVKSGEFYFSEPLKALSYAFILRKRTGAVIPKAIYNKLMAEVKASQPAPEQESKPAEVAADDAQAAAEPSPLARQYREMKAKHPDAILLFRVGDFYESFGDDAEVVADVCGLVLSRVDEFFHYEKPAYRAAFPAHALDSYLPRLVRAGKCVAICDAMADMIKKESK